MNTFHKFSLYLVWVIGLLLPFSSQAQGGCSLLTPEFINFEPCKYRVKITNESECTPSITVLVDPGFDTWVVNSATGWTAAQLGPGEILLTHANGFVPIGTSFPLIFTIQPSLNPLGNFQWDFICGIGESCTTVFGIPLEACIDPADANIGGVKYRECGELPYNNQAIIPGWTIQLLDEGGNLLAEQQTDASGEYRFFDLPLGKYIVKEIAAPGWTPKVPASGEYLVDLDVSEEVTRNFGNCPSCSCDSIVMDVVQLPLVTDTCAYILLVDNSDAYCFQTIDIALGTGTAFTSWVANTGWTATLQNPQLLRVTPTLGYIPTGNLAPVFFRITGAATHQITVSTTWSSGGMSQTCGRSFEKPCPPLPAPPPCCPAGSLYGPELVANGDFEQGNMFFTNNYTYFLPGNNTQIGQYSVLNYNQVYPANNQWSALDHTASLLTGQMLIVDGYGGQTAWQQTINVTAGTTYSFSAWFNNLVKTNKDYDDPNMQLFVGSTPVAGPTGLIPEIPDAWVRLCGTWTATTTGPVTLSIRMLATTSIGNDVAIDDVSFRACIPPQPCEVNISAVQDPNDCDVTLTATASGAQPISLLWCNGPAGPTFTYTQTPCIPYFYCVTATCADGTSTTTSFSFTATDNTPPVITNCPTGVQQVNTLPGQCFYQGPLPALTATDNCGVDRIDCFWLLNGTLFPIVPNTVFPKGNHTIQCQAVDFCGNVSQTCTYTLQVRDNQPPLITCPQNVYTIGFIDAAGQCKAIVNGIAATATDNCPMVSIAYVLSGATQGQGAGDASGTQFMQGTTTVTYTATDMGGNTATCSFTVNVVCSDVSCNCDPGHAPGPDLIINGNFQAGNTGFSSDYNPLPPTCSPKEYIVTDPVQVQTVCNNWAANDHTTGNSTAGWLFFAADGSQTPGDDAWFQQINLTAGTTYKLCFWAKNLNYLLDRPDPILEVYILDAAQNPVGGPIFSTGPIPEDNSPAVWHQFMTSFTATSGSVYLSFRTAGTSFEGNNFALDDISLRSCTPPPCTVSISAVQDPNDCDVTLTAVTGGAQPISVQWCSGQITPSFTTTQTPCTPYTYCITATCADGTTATASLSFTATDVTPPVITNCPTTVQQVSTLPGLCYYQGPLPTLAATDNCGVAGFDCFLLVNGVFIPITPNTQFTKGDHTIRCRAFDFCGNISLSCTYTLQVRDTELPTIMCPLNVNVIGFIDAAGQCKAIVNGIAATATDNCPMLGVSYVLSGATQGQGSGDASGTLFMQGTTTVTYTATDMAGNTATCSFTVSVACSDLSCSCEPGSISGPDLIIDGNFQTPGDFFSSDYNPLPPTCSPKEFIVTDPIQVTTVCNNWAATDHTTGNSTAGWMFFAADGSQTLGDDAWYQQINLTAGVTYKLCFWAKSLNYLLDRPDPIVEAYILDAAQNPVGGPIFSTGPIAEANSPAVWNFYTTSWTATGSGTFYLSFRTAETSFEGNNFALDDISFRACTPPPSCVCGTFSDMSYRPNAGAPNVPIGCNEIAIWNCSLPNFMLGGNFMCQGDSCPPNIPMFWTLTGPGNVPAGSGTMTGPGFSVSVPNSAFINPGLYTLTLAGICGSDTCYCDIIIETPGCDTCACGEVVWAQFYRTWDWYKPISCNNANNPLAVPCLKPGQNYFIHGDFTCSSADCGNGTVTWELDRPNPLSNVTGFVTGFYPHFDITLLGTYFTQPGTYQLTVTRTCGTSSCSCTFTFEVLPCACNCQEIASQAGQGFSVSGNKFSCKRTFKPVANLCANDVVNWHVNGPLVATTNGNGSFTYTFPGNGMYWVCMVVIRTDPVTGQVCTYKRCRWVKVWCLFGPLEPIPYACKVNDVLNGEFLEGVVPGELSLEGAADNWEWFPNTGNGAVFVDSSAGANDDGFLLMQGGLGNFGAVYQKVDLTPNNYINLDFYYHNLQGTEVPEGTVLEFRLHVDSMAGSDNSVLYTHPISKDTSEGGWQYVFASVPTSTVNFDYKYLVVCLRNNDEQQRSLAALDNVYICSSTDQLTDTDEADDTSRLRIFPNPNTGAFTAELPRAAGKDERLRIIDPTGRLMYEQVTATGATQQSIQCEQLPAGLYYLQLLTEGRVSASIIFVKQ